MAHKIIASQFTYASRAIATPERHCPTQCALAHAFAKVIDQASIAVHARIAVPMTDHSASHLPRLLCA